MEKKNPKHYFRFHERTSHLFSAFGDHWFGQKAEAFARFFGTPTFLIVQSILVLLWITLNVLGIVKFDLYPFILLNLAFSLQSAYAAPLILLAQTRQSDRDKASADADSCHRETIAKENAEREQVMIDLLKQNTELTKEVQELAKNIKQLTQEVHQKLMTDK